MANTLLLTGTIDPNVFNTNKDDKPINVYLTDARERLNQYNAAIERYIKESSFDSIVFAENSGAKFDFQRFELLASSTERSSNTYYVYLAKDRFLKCSKKASLMEKQI